MAVTDSGLSEGIKRGGAAAACAASLLLLFCILAIPSPNSNSIQSPEHDSGNLPPTFQPISGSEIAALPQVSPWSDDESSPDNVAPFNEATKLQHKPKQLLSPTFDNEQDNDAPVPQNLPWVKQRHYVNVNLHVLNGEIFEFQPVVGKTFQIVPRKFDNPSATARTLVGEMLDSAGKTIGQMTLAAVDGESGLGYSGRFSLDNGTSYLLHHDSHGNTVVDVVKPEELPECADGEHKTVDSHEPRQAAAESDVELQAPPAHSFFTAEDSGKVKIRVMFVWSPKARNAAGGSAAIQARVHQAVADANTAYTNSEISITLELAHMYELTREESGNFNTDLNWLTYSDGYWDGVHSERETHAADAVAMFNDNYAYCGLGWIGPYKSRMFGVTNQYCAAFQTFAHELGHNQGAMHAPGDTSGSGRYTYSYGHRFYGSDSAQYRTVMAYSPGSRLSYFSNPNVSYKGVATGTSSRDNAQTLNNTASTVANYYGEVYKISGVITQGGKPLPGVSVSGAGLGSTITDNNGEYFLSGPEGSSYLVQPALNGFGFLPEKATGTLDGNKIHNFAANSAPSISPLSDISMSRGDGQLTRNLIASDAEGDLLSFSATIKGSSQAAYALDQALNFTGPGSSDFYYNYRGWGEKYLKSGDTWYIILNNGQVKRFVSTPSNSPLVGTVEVEYWQDPNLLIDVPPPSTGQVSAEISGSTLTLTPAQGFIGSVLVTVSVSDGVGSSTTSFRLTVSNSPPALNQPADILMSHREDSKSVALSASDSDGDAVALTAKVHSLHSTALQLDQQYDFSDNSGGTYYFNYRGAQEKYLQTSNGIWFVLLPSGELRRFTNSVSASPHVANLDASYWNTPSKLIDVPLSGDGPATTSISGDTLTISPTDGFIGTFVVTVTASDGAAEVSKSFSVTVSNAAVEIQEIADISISHDTSTSIPLSASDADNDPITFTASMSSTADVGYALDQSRNFRAPHSTYYLNYRGAGEKYLVDHKDEYYFLLPNGQLRRFTGKISSSPLIATLTPAYWEDPTKLIDAPEPTESDRDAALSISGSTLTITPKAGFVGSFTVNVSATDGADSDSTSFTVDITNGAPVIEEIDDQVVSRSTASVPVPVNATDPDGDSLTLKATAVSEALIAYGLDQVYDFGDTSGGNYYVNYRGAQEKYLQGSGKWFAIKPNGEFGEYTNNISKLKLLATFSSKYYQDPSLLIDVAEPTDDDADVTLSLTGNTLSVSPKDGFVGTAQIVVTATDGSATAAEAFELTFVNSAPVLQVIADVSVSHSAGPFNVTLVANDSDGDPLTYSAKSQGPADVAYSLDQKYDFSSPHPTFYYNYRGAGEKYLKDSSGNWYYILPDGKVYKFAGSVDRKLVLGELNSEYYSDPSMLVDVRQPASNESPASLSISGSTLTVSPTESFAGTFKIEVSVTDGAAIDSQSFNVTIANNPPLVSGINDIELVKNTIGAIITLVASDSDGDSVTFSSSAVAGGVMQAAYEAHQTHQFYSGGNYFYNYRGAAEKYIQGRNGWYIILPNGDLRLFKSSISTSKRVAMLDPSFHTDPSRLFMTTAPAAGVNVAVVDNMLSITPQTDFVGSVSVTVTASDGRSSNSTVFEVTVVESSEDVDSDGDGVSNAEEIEAGTDPYDSGSFVRHLKDVVYTVWNSYLSMINVLELVNPTLEDTEVTVSLYAIDGTLAGKQTVVVRAQNKFDVILNDMEGFVPQSYGIVKLEFNNVIDGHLLFYRGQNGRAGLSSSSFDYVFAVPLAVESYGNTAVGFNTFQPSTNSAELSNEVSNWLSVINLASESAGYTIKTYNQRGEILLTRNITVPAFGRLDLDGGHVTAGPSVVGVHIIEPTDAEKPYIAQLIRYGADTAAGTAPTSYDFAFPMLAKAGTGQETIMGVSSRFGEDNWLEVINVLGVSVEVRLSILNESGEKVFEQPFTLLPHAQHHVKASDYLSPGEGGIAKVMPNVSNSIISQSMFYHRDNTGSITRMFGTQSASPTSYNVFGSFNLYLDMLNFLRVSNPGEETVDFKIMVNGPTVSSEREYSIAPGATVYLALHDGEAFQTSADSYGVVVVTAKDENVKLASELVRVQESFAVTTVVR